MNETKTLNELLRQAAGELQAQSAPASVRAGVLAAFDARPAPPSPRRWRGLLAWSGAATCALVLLASALLMLLPQPEAAPAEGFVPVAPAERWASARAAGPAWLVNAELPRERLAELGLPYDPARAGETVRAELLLHPAGDVLAVRFLN